MNHNGALRKVMLIVLLSILGSYCIASQDNPNASIGMVDTALQSTYSLVTSVGSYCYKLWTELTGQSKNVSKIEKDDTVVIQAMDLNYIPYGTYDATHGNDYACTDGREHCEYNEDFFNDTWFTGTMDEDPTTHIDPDTRPMTLVQD